MTRHPPPTPGASHFEIIVTADAVVVRCLGCGATRSGPLDAPVPELDPEAHASAGCSVFGAALLGLRRFAETSEVRG